MRRLLIAALIVVALGLGLVITLHSRRRLKVGGTLEEIEWVIVACHTVPFWEQWVAKLTPESDAKLIGRLVAAIEGADWVRESSETGGDAFVVVKIKGRGVRSFNIIPWHDDEEEVEIRPAFSSRELYPILLKMGEEKIGWKTDDSLPDLAVREIQVRQDGNLAGVFRPHSPSFARVAAAAEQVLNAFDPRWCMPNYKHGNPTDARRYQKMPQFALLLEKPIPMYKLTVVSEKGGRVVAGVRYKAFSSSTIVLYSSRQPTALLADLYISFVPDGAPNTSFTWCFDEAHRVPETMSRPDAYEAFKKLLQVFEDSTEQDGSP